MTEEVTAGISEVQEDGVCQAVRVTKEGAAPLAP